MVQSAPSVMLTLMNEHMCKVWITISVALFQLHVWIRLGVERLFAFGFASAPLFVVVGARARSLSLNICTQNIECEGSFVLCAAIGQQPVQGGIPRLSPKVSWDSLWLLSSW